eukprot:3248418-Amphidinium_carterae.1
MVDATGADIPVVDDIHYLTGKHDCFHGSLNACNTHCLTYLDANFGAFGPASRHLYSEYGRLSEA